MRTMQRMNKIVCWTLLLSWLPVVVSAAANEVIPYSIKSLSVAQGGFLKLMGPGKVVAKGRVIHYKQGKYIRARNIHSMSEVEGIVERCILHYASYDFSENITVQHSCSKVMSLIQSAESGGEKKIPNAMPKFKIE